MPDPASSNTVPRDHPDRYLFEVLALWQARGQALDEALDEGTKSPEEIAGLRSERNFALTAFAGTPARTLDGIALKLDVAAEYLEAPIRALDPEHARMGPRALVGALLDLRRAAACAGRDPIAALP